MAGTPSLLLGAFELQERVAVGGVGEVWRAVHCFTRVSAAVKLLNAGYANDAHARAALRAELRAVACLDHPNIVFVFGTGEVSAEVAERSGGRLTPGAAWIAMEYAEGGTLRDRAGEFTWSAVQNALLDVLAGLAHAHARGFIHGDVKPANLLVGGVRGGVKIADFGIARRIEGDGRRRAGRTSWGSPAFMAPEQARADGAPLGAWTDLYALGCTAWALLTGAPPFKGEPAAVLEQHVSASLPPLISSHPLPEGAEPWLRRLLVKDPALRVRHAAEASWSLAAISDRANGTSRPRPAARSASAAEVTQAVAPVDSPVRLRLEMVGLAENTLPESFPARPVPPPPLGGHLGGVGLELLALRSFPVVGREVEQAFLWGRLRDVVERGEARAVVVRGPSGVGTSRLARWLTESAAELGLCRPMVVAYGASGGAPRGLRSAFHQVLRLGRLTRSGAGQALEAAAPALEAEDRSALAGWLLGGGRPAPLPRAERLSLWKRVLAALVHAVPPTGEGRPLVVWVDACEVGSAEALSLVRSMVGSDIPVLFVLTVGDERLPSSSVEAALLEELRLQSAVDELRIAELSPPACRELLETHLGLAPDFAEDLGRRTNGNPLFVMLLLGDFAERRLLETTPMGVRPSKGAEVFLPAALEREWVARAERVAEGLLPGELESVEVLAVLGDPASELEWTEACATLGVAPGFELLDRLEAEGLLTRPGEDTVWRFVHGMFREALERRAARAGRLEAAHRACAATLSRLGKRAHTERVGRHLLLSGDLVGSLQPLSLAIEDRILAREAGPAASLTALRAEALNRAGVAEADERVGEQRFLDALLAHLRNDIVRAERALFNLRAEIDGNGWVGVQARADWFGGRIARSRGRQNEAASQFRAAIASGQIIGDVRTMGRSRAELAEMLAESGDWAGAAAEFEAARSLFEQLDDPAGLGDVHLGLALLDCKTAQHTESAAHLRLAIKAFQRMRNEVGVARAWNVRGDLHRLSGRFDAAAEDYRGAIRVLEATNNWMAVLPHVNLGLLLLARGEEDPAHSQLSQTLPELQKHGAADAEVYVRIGLTITSLRRGDVAAAAATRRSLSPLLTAVRKRDPEIVALLEVLRQEATRVADGDALAWLEQEGV